MTRNATFITIIQGEEERDEMMTVIEETSLPEYDVTLLLLR